MAAQTDQRAEPRAPLTRERVLRAAIDLADEGGIESLSMRKLGEELGVKAMSLYNHVDNKEDILDGMVDLVVGEIDPPSREGDWQTAMRQLALSARKTLLRHPWAKRVIESRTNPGPAMLRYWDSVVGILREGGFSVDMAHHAVHVLGSRVLGFTQDLMDESEDLAPSPQVAAVLAREMANQYPYITEMAVAVSHDEGLGGCDDDMEFEFGLDLILDGLETFRDEA